MCAPFDSISRLLCINAMQCIYLHHQKQESNKPIYQIEEKKNSGRNSDTREHNYIRAYNTNNPKSFSFYHLFLCVLW